MEGHLLCELSALCFHKTVLIKKPRTSKSCLWFPIWQLLSVRVLRLMVSKCFWWRAIYCGYDHFIITQIHVPSQKLFSLSCPLSFEKAIVSIIIACCMPFSCALEGRSLRTWRLKFFLSISVSRELAHFWVHIKYSMNKELAMKLN